MILDLAVIKGRNEPFNEENVIPRRGVGVREVIENPHPRVQFLDRLIRELDHTSELCSQQLGVAFGEEVSLILVQGFLGGFWPGDGGVHH